MRILHVINSLQIGGAEKLLISVARRQSDFGHSVKVVAISTSRVTINLHGVDVEYLDRNLWNPLIFFDLTRISKNFDIAHFHLAPAQYYSLFCSCAIFITEHNEKNRRWRFKLFKYIDKFYYTKVATKVIAISNAVAKSIGMLGVSSSKIETIYNGIDVEEIKNMSNFKLETKIPEKINLEKISYIVMVSRFSPQKDHSKFLQIANEMRDINFILIGDGETREKTIEMASVMQLTNLFFAGAVENPYPIMKMCDIALQFSHWEGFGIAAIENMALGLPTITTNTPGLNELNVELPLMPFFTTPRETAKFIYLLLSDHKLYEIYAKRARKIASSYSISTTVEEYIRMYENT